MPSFPGLKPVTVASFLSLALFIPVGQHVALICSLLLLPIFSFTGKKIFITAFQVQTPPSLPSFPAQPAREDRGQTYQQLPLLTAGGAPGAVLPALHTSFCLIPVTTPRKPSPFQRDKIAHLALRTSTSLLYFFSTWRLSLNAEQRWPWRKGEMCPFSKPTRQGRANAYTLQESALRLNITIGTVPPQNGCLRKQQGPPSTAHVRSGKPSAKTNLKEILILGKMDLD